MGYVRSGNWDWEHYPPPFDFLAPRNSAAMPAPVIGVRGSGWGMSGCGCGCKGSGACGDGDHSHGGLGLFEAGLDYSRWTVAEWGAVAVGGYLVLSLVGDFFTAKNEVQGYRQYRRKARA